MARVCRRLCVLGLLAVLVAHGAPVLRALQDRPLQADGVVRLLLDLENAMATARIEDFRALAIPEIPSLAVSRFQLATRGGPGARAIIRERMRRPVGNDFEVVVDLLVSRQAVGRVSTWQLMVTPATTPAGTFKISDVKELAAVDGLMRLSLDTKRQFAVKDLVITAPDLQLKMSSGTAFVAESSNGVTAVVLRGKGEVHFTPPDPAEQVQLQIFDGKPAYSSQSDAFFVRLNPAAFVLTFSENSLVPARLDPREAAKAQAVFDELAPRTYNIDLRNLTPERWSIEPTYGSLVAEFKSDRGWLTYARSPSDHEDISLFDRGDQRNIALYASTEKIKERGRFYSEDDGAPFDIEHYRLNLAFDPARLWVSGRASITVRVTSSSLSSLSIKLAPQLAVASVSSPAFGDLLALRIIGQNTVLIGLPTFVEPDSRFTVEVVYGGRLEPQPLDREAIAPQGQQQQGTVDQDLVRLTPEPRFLYSSRLPWYPQSGTSDYATVEMRLSVPSEYQIVASGSLVRATVTPNPDPVRNGSKAIRTAEFVSDRPVRYLACVISRFVPLGRSRVDVPGGAGLNLEVVSTARMAGKNRQMAQRVAGMLKYFATTIGEAPYPDFTLAALDDNLPGGHSPAFFAVFHQPLPTTPYSWSADPVSFDDTYQHLFLAHEVAHQWWGQAIGWKNYHEQWLSEGLAQYFAALYAAEDRGPAMLQTLIAEMRESTTPYFSQGPISLGYRLGHIKHDGRVFRAIVYNKSAVVLHMLRRLIGDQAFFGGIRQFYTTWQFKKAGTEDLQAVFEAAANQKLDRFFDQWVRGFHRPRIRLTVHTLEGGAPAIRVEQLGELFDFPLTVSIQYADGRVEDRTIKVTDRIVDDPVSAPVRRVTTKELLTPFEQVR